MKINHKKTDRFLERVGFTKKTKNNLFDCLNSGNHKGY
jgi:hypothetical protein